MKIAILHLDLGIGGAEKLIISIAISLINSGHDITIYTSHHDKLHCFEETINNGILANKIVVLGDWLPRDFQSIFFKKQSNSMGMNNGGTAFFAFMRMLYIGAYICLQQLNILNDSSAIDCIIIDGVSFPIPLFSCCAIPTIFYCHYPDKMLCLNRNANILKRVYRTVLDYVEEVTTGCSDIILVNSKYTSSIFADAFPYLNKQYKPSVLYPVVEFEKDEDVSYVIKHRGSILPFNPEQYDHIYTSLNRYERKKNIKLALESMEVVREKYDPSYSKLIIKKPIHILLVIAGGYDERVIENVEYFQELYELAQQYKFHIVSEDNSASNVAMSEVNSTNVCTVHIIFRKSISKLERIALLLNSTALLYTPANEHFGIVPIESMYLECPVIAISSGGPKETVSDGITGYLTPQNKFEYASAILKFIYDRTLTKQFGNAGKLRVEKLFSPRTLSVELNQYVQKCTSNYKFMNNKRVYTYIQIILFQLITFIVLLVSIGIVVVYK